MRMKKLSIEEREELLRELLVKLHRGVIHEGLFPYTTLFRSRKSVV